MGSNIDQWSFEVTDKVVEVTAPLGHAWLPFVKFFPKTYLYDLQPRGAFVGRCEAWQEKMMVFLFPSPSYTLGLSKPGLDGIGASETCYCYVRR